MKITGAIFDLDGTLLNSMDYWAFAPHEYLISLGITPKENTSKLFLENGMKNWYDFCQKEYGLKAPFDEAKEKIYEIMYQKYSTVVEIKDGARQMLETLYNSGVKMCLATATDRFCVERVLKRLNIDKYFSRIFTSGEVGIGKNSPRIYEVALEFLGTDKETTYIFEDAVYAMRTAYNNGFMVVGVYDKNVYATEDEIKKLCHIYLDKNSLYKLPIEE
ncbi:MAG: HAD family phosphatase [Clostridia bacterium]|nr:HAD family phosphatase [Clostridia bacterium]